MSVLFQKRDQSGDALIENRFVAEKLNEVANLLDQHRASVFRVRAYRDAAHRVAGLSQPLHDFLDASVSHGLEILPALNTSVSKAIIELVETGNLGLIDKLTGDHDPEKLFQSIPLIGKRLARSIHDQLKIDTLESLEKAAYDGRLLALKGVGRRRVDGIKNALSEYRARQRPTLNPALGNQPSVANILRVDRAYRAAVDELPAIAPRRLKAAGLANIPLLQTEQSNWRLTAIFCNTPAAHNYLRTRDWVVVYFQQDQHDQHTQGQCTVVTEHRGPLKGKRVIRGREAACEDYYRSNRRAF